MSEVLTMPKPWILIFTVLIFLSSSTCEAIDEIKDLKFIKIGETTNGVDLLDTGNLRVFTDKENNLARVQGILCVILNDVGREHYAKVGKDFFYQAEGVLFAFDIDYQENTYQQRRLTVYAPYGKVLYTDINPHKAITPKEDTEAYFWSEKVKKAVLLLHKDSIKS